MESLNNSSNILIKCLVLILIIGSTLVINILLEMNMTWSLVFNWTIYSACIMFLITIFSKNDTSIYD